MTGNSLEVSLDAPVPTPIEVGNGSMLLVEGEFRSALAPPGRIWLQTAGQRHRAIAFRGRPMSGTPTWRFSGTVELAAGSADPDSKPISLHGPSGSWPVAAPKIVRRLPAPTTLTSDQGEPQPLAEIAICMATYRPDPTLLQRQIESLRAQTVDDWICVISDDGSSPEQLTAIERLVSGDRRFKLSRSARRLGAYLNFERALRLVPPESRLIAFCDQDDYWYPEKLERLREAIGDRSLVFSDCRLVDRNHRVLADTYWGRRRNNYENLASLVLANTVTGAASLFRRELLVDALPFPPSAGAAFHDHWIAQVALCSRGIAYVDEPLYDYVQHDLVTIGHAVANSSGLRRTLSRSRAGGGVFEHAYLVRTRQAEIDARMLQLRCGDRVRPDAARSLARLARISSSFVAAVWLALRPLRLLLGRNETMGREHVYLAGAGWRWGQSARLRLSAIRGARR